MIERSLTHTVPDQEVIVEMTEVPEETFYNHVLSRSQLQAQIMETTDSDCSSESGDGKIYMPLVSDMKYAQVPSSPMSERLLSADRINLYSWKMRHPKNWQSQDITNWIYYVCSRDINIDRYKIKAENFNRVQGHHLCAMSREEFIHMEPNYGADLYYCLQCLLRPAHYKAPDENIEMTQFEEVENAHALCPPPMWSSAMLTDEDQEMDLVRALDLELNPGSGVVVIGDKQYDYLSDDGFDDIPRLAVVAGESGYGSDDSGRSSPPVANMPPPPAHMHYPPYMAGHQYAYPVHHTMRHTPVSPPPAHIHTAPEQSYHTQHVTTPPAPKPRGRPRREGHTPGQRGRKPGTSTTKGNHLWKFIRDTINNSHYNPDIIRWEDEQQGIFRIVNSGEMARLWGEKKNNRRMTYEKFSRAMRDYYKSNILRRVGSRKLVYAFGTKVFPHLIVFPEYTGSNRVVHPYPHYG